MKKIVFIASTLALNSFIVNAQEIIQPTKLSKTSFAIIVDEETYLQTKNEISVYQKSVEKDGIGTYIVHHNWKNPEEIKSILHQLYQNKKQPLEGAVFVGKIPIPMIRGAQVLTSAFKMIETVKWENSSVPSDRYYDDFDLKFDFIKQDENELRSNYFYYNLSADSPNYISMDIYTGRIKPPVESDNDNEIEQIKKYLVKLVQVKEENNPLNNMIASTGYGYNSNSMASWGNELIAFRSTFPNLFSPQNSIKFLNYRNSDFMKNQLISELRNENLDFAFMTGHGTPTLQLLNGYPDVSSPQPSMENVGRYIRSKMINAKESKRDLEKVKKDFQTSLGLNDKWFEDSFDQKRIDEDSITNQKMDIHSIDLENINVRVAYLNSCLTGSFHKKDYLAGHYPFSNGKNVVAFANTVGVLQDLWSTQLIGILQDGARVGHLLKKTAFLETHILGDPTYHFNAENSSTYNALFANRKASKKEWYKLLKTNNADLQSYSLTELYKLEDEAIFSKKLKDIFLSSPYETVRTQAYYQLRKYNNNDYKTILPIALHDNYEYLKRKALYDINDIGEDKFINEIVNAYINDQDLARSQYKINWMFQFFNYDKMIAELNKQLKGNTTIFNADDLLANALKKVEYEKSKNKELINNLSQSKLSEKELNFEIRSLRLYRHHSVVPQLIAIVNDESKSIETRKITLDALSWFGQSYQKETIINSLNNLIQKETNEEIKKLALKSINAIKDATKRQF